MANDNMKNPEATTTTADQNSKPESAKKNLFGNAANKVNGANSWFADKVRAYPRIACGLFLSIGVAAGWALKSVVEIVAAKGNDDEPIETEFADTDSAMNSTTD